MNKINEFRASAIFSEKVAKISILHSNIDEHEINCLIHSSGSKGSVFLLTKEFGRGVDFQSKDKLFLEKKGISVIQTFLSEDPSEETQIKGRCARPARLILNDYFSKISKEVRLFEPEGKL